MKGTRRSDAVAHVFGLIIALALFSAMLTYVVFAGIQQGQEAGRSETPDLDGAANSLAAILIGQPGMGWYPAVACEDGELDTEQMDADQVADGRFGLGREACEPPLSLSGDVNHLDFAKLVNLRNALLEADGTNEHVDYAEARTSLGMDETNKDFHIRSEPVLRSVRDILASGFKDPFLRPLYIGDYLSVDSGGEVVERLVDHDFTLTEDSSNITLNLEIHNNGTTATIFEVQVTIPLASGSVDFVHHTPEIEADATHTRFLVLPKSSDWTWAQPGNPTFDYVVSDPDGPVGSGSISAGGIDMRAGAGENPLVLVSAEKPFFKLKANNKVNGDIYYTAYNASGVPKTFADWTLRIVDADGDNAFSPRVLGSSTGSSEEYQFTSAQTYTARLENDAGTTLWNHDRINVRSDDPSPFTPSGGSGDWVPAASVPAEAGFLGAVIELFDPQVFHPDYGHSTVPHAPEGDIFPDVKTVMNQDLRAVLIDDKGTPTTNDDEATLEHYNVIVVGSNVDHSAMTSAAAKQAIRDWVYAGGLLIVMGSTAQAVQWLQPIFSSGIESAGGGISTPDQNHPILQVPNDLDYEAYDTHDIVWSFSQPSDAERFTNVITDGEDPYLTLSDPGAYGDGRVLLSSFQAFDLVDGQEADCTPGAYNDACEPLLLLHNFLTIAYQGLYIDYGPPLPTDRPHGSVVRLATTDHPELGSRVAMSMFIYVF